MEWSHEQTLANVGPEFSCLALLFIFTSVKNKKKAIYLLMRSPIFFYKTVS